MKKNSPIITHTEIICYAILHLQSVIKDRVAYLDGIPGSETFLETFLAQHMPKLEALKELYRIETGTDYGE